MLKVYGSRTMLKVKTMYRLVHVHVQFQTSPIGATLLGSRLKPISTIRMFFKGVGQLDIAAGKRKAAKAAAAGKRKAAKAAAGRWKTVPHQTYHRYCPPAPPSIAA